MNIFISDCDLVKIVYEFISECEGKALSYCIAKHGRDSVLWESTSFELNQWLWICFWTWRTQNLRLWFFRFQKSHPPHLWHFWYLTFWPFSLLWIWVSGLCSICSLYSSIWHPEDKSFERTQLLFFFLFLKIFGWIVVKANWVVLCEVVMCKCSMEQWYIVVL